MTAMPSSAILSAVLLSLLCAAAAVILCLPPAVALAWLMARKHFRGKTLLEVLIMLPLVVPPVVTGYVLLVTLGRHGWAGSLLHDLFHLRVAFTWIGAAIAQAVIALPLMVLTLRVAIESVDPDLEQAAVTMGASRLRVFFRVTLPLSRHGLAAGCVLGFARALGEFGATIMIAGNIPGRTQTLPLAIFSAANQPGNEAAVAGLILITIALAAGSLILARYLSGRTLRNVVLQSRKSGTA